MSLTNDMMQGATPLSTKKEKEMQQWAIDNGWLDPENLPEEDTTVKGGGSAV